MSFQTNHRFAFGALLTDGPETRWNSKVLPTKTSLPSSYRMPMGQFKQHREAQATPALKQPSNDRNRAEHVLQNYRWSDTGISLPLTPALPVL